MSFGPGRVIGYGTPSVSDPRRWAVAAISLAALAVPIEHVGAVEATDGIVEGIMESRATVRFLVQRSRVAGTRHGELALVRDGLRVGDDLELSREPDNPYDPRAIRVDWRGHKLGYVPRRDNGALAWALDRGEALAARISALPSRPRSGARIDFEVYLE